MTDLDEPLDGRRLLAFKLLARSASFAEAAAAMGVTPSAMSHTIKVLEQEMGGELFDRRGYRAVLTALGEKLLPLAERILRQMRALRAETHAMQKWGSGTLRIAAPTSACQYFLPSVLLEFRACFPACTLNITAADSESAAFMVEEGRADLALCIRSELSDSVQWSPLFEDQMSFFVSAMHPWATVQKLSRKDLSNQAIIVYDRATVTTKLIFASLKKQGIHPGDVLTLGSMEAIKEMVKIGLGVGILANWVTTREMEAGSLVRAAFPWPRISREWGIASFKNQRTSFVAETFIGLCREVATTLET